MARVYSKANRYYFSGDALTGLGSPHTPAGYIWPLATAMEALISSNTSRQAALLKVGREPLSITASRGRGKGARGPVQGQVVGA
jgi:meiotically up-regulated gene 157 (Mug157) protein